MNIKVLLRLKAILGITLIGVAIYMIIGSVNNMLGSSNFFSRAIFFDILIILITFGIPASLIYAGYHLIKKSTTQTSIDETVTGKNHHLKNLIPWIFIFAPLIPTSFIIPGVDQGGYIVIFYVVYLLLAIPALIISQFMNQPIRFIINILVSIPPVLFVILLLSLLFF